jgi:hypothetical protein
LFKLTSSLAIIVDIHDLVLGKHVTGAQWWWGDFLVLSAIIKFQLVNHCPVDEKT